jgi:ABC-type transport system involved in cytochrome bd biosynthesis fused ATPase/permease subunit
MPDLRALRNEIEEVKQHQADLSARMVSIAQTQSELHTIASTLEGIKTMQADLSARMAPIAQAQSEIHTIASALEAIKTTQAELSARMVDQLQGADDLLACGQEEMYQQRALALSDQLNQSQERLAVIRGLSVALGGLLASLAGLTVLGLAIPLVTSGHIDGVYLALLPLTALASFEAVQPLALMLDREERARIFSKPFQHCVQLQLRERNQELSIQRNVG